MKIAAVNFEAAFADRNENLNRLAEFVPQAAEQGVELIVFPEFCTSSMGFSSSMLEAAAYGNSVQAYLKQLSARYRIIIGGSYLWYDGTDAYNLFELVFPDGAVFSHKKDIPTIAENCYYTRGDKEHILHTPIGDIGVALCWEMVRYDTLKRLSGKVDFVLAGMCWADLPDWEGGEQLKQYNRDFARRAPVRFAEYLGAPVIHANHCGTITAYDFPDDQKLNTLQMVGATQIIDESGNILSERAYNEGAGMAICDLQRNMGKRPQARIDPAKYWLEDLPDPYVYAWEHHNKAGEAYYRSVAKPHYASSAKG